MVRALAKRCAALCRRAAHRQKEILRSRNVALSLRRAAHGTCAQLLHWRRARALHVDERLQRASSHGLGFLRLARGKRGHPEQHAAAPVDAEQHRENEGADEAPRLRLRLVPRGHHLFARLLPLEPVVLSQVLREGSGLSQERAGSTGARNAATVLANEQVCKTDAAGATKTRWSRSASSSSGSCASPSTPTNCCAISTSSTAGPKKFGPCSAIGSAAAKALSSISNSTTRPPIPALAPQAGPSAFSLRGSTPSSAQLRCSSRPASHRRRSRRRQP